MIGVIVFCVNHTENLDDTFHFREVADFGFECGEEANRGEAGRFVTFFFGKSVAEFANDERAVGAAWYMAGEEDQVSCSSRSNVVGD